VLSLFSPQYYQTMKRICGITIRRCPLVVSISATLLGNLARVLNCRDFPLHSLTCFNEIPESRAMRSIKPWSSYLSEISTYRYCTPEMVDYGGVFSWRPPRRKRSRGRSFSTSTFA
jgi:hypothetical protein